MPSDALSTEFADAFLTRLRKRGGTDPYWISEGRSYTWGDLARAIDRWCGLFDLAELGHNARVVIVTRDDWTATTLFIASLLEGLVPTILSPSAGDPRVTAVIETMEASLVVTDPDRADAPWAAGAVIAGPADDAGRALLSDIGQTPLARLLDIASARPPRATARRADRAYVLFTSGTTGAPKGAVLRHGNLAAQMRDLTRVLNLRPGARIGNGLQLSHTDGLIQGPILAAWSGATLLRPAPFAVGRVSAWMAFLRDNGVTHVIAAPTLLEMLDRFATGADSFGPAIEVVLSSAAPLPTALWDRIEARFGGAVVNEYGMTECVAASHFAGPLPDMGARYTIGLPVGCRDSLRDPETLAEVAEGEIGELWLKGPQVFEGYLGAPVATATRMHNGWLRSGDLARRLPGGSIQIEGRLATAFNSGGFLVLPEEIDEVLLAVDGVRDAKTIGLPDASFGTIAVAFVVSDSPVDPSAMVRICQAQLEHWKVPRHVFEIDAVPRSAAGKADLAALARDAERRLTPGTARPRPGLAPSEVREMLEQVFHMQPGSAASEMGPDQIPGWDSYAHTVLILELEDRGIELSPQEAQGLRTIGDILTACGCLA